MLIAQAAAPETEALYDGPSKSQLKRESDALQKLGARLAELSPERLKKIDMPEDLRDALRDVQRITAHGAHRRQLQLIGKIMRGIDAAPLQAALDEIDGVSAAATARLHRIERLREQVLANEQTIGALAREHPGLDIQQLRQLRRNALKERELAKPARAFREIFQILKDLEFATEAGEADLTGQMPSEDR